MASLDKINDKCWQLLDAVHLGDFFDSRGLPPLLFPLLIILLIFAAMFLMSPGQNPCGDRTCDEATETCSTCALDCGACAKNKTAGFILTVELSGAVSEPVTVTIYNKNGAEITGSMSQRGNLFEFTDVKPQQVKATVSCSNGQKRSSKPQEVDKENNVITLSIPDNCFEYVTDTDNDPMETYGNIEVSVYDGLTGDPLDAKVVAVRASDDLEEASVLTEDGGGTINVRADVLYYLMASKEGYEDYKADSDKIYMVPGDTISRVVYMTSMASSGSGTLQVCAFSGQNPLQSGRISILKVGGSEIDWAALIASSNGCANFEVPAGQAVKAALGSPPANCAAPSVSDDIFLEPGETKSVRLEVACGNVAFVKVIVHNRLGQVMTDKVKVTLWKAVSRDQVPGTAPDSSLAMGSSGYTEEVSVPANIMIQAKAAGAPVGYIDTESGPGPFSPGEHGSIDIFLGEVARTAFDFPGASIIYTPASPGMPVTVFIQQITYNKTTLTPQNSDVKVIINGEEYDVTYTPGQ